MPKKKARKSRRGKKEKIEEQMAALAAERDSLQRRFQDSESTREGAVRETQELRERLETIREEADVLTAGRKELEAKLREAESARDSASKEVEALRRRLEAAEEARGAAGGLEERLRDSKEKLAALVAERDSLRAKLREAEAARAAASGAQEREAGGDAGAQQELDALGAELARSNREIAELRARAERAESGEAEAKRRREEAGKTAGRVPPRARRLLIASSAAALLFFILMIIGFARNPGKKLAADLASEERKHREARKVLNDTRKALDDTRRRKQDAEGKAAAAERGMRRTKNALNAARGRAEDLDSQIAELREQLDGQRARYRKLERTYKAASAAERGGKLADAIGLYKRALEMTDDAELRTQVAELERRLLLKTRLAEADGLADGGSWKAANEAYLKALQIAHEDEAGRIRSKLAAAKREIHYLDLVEKAVAASQAAEWQEALDAARHAVAVRPETQEAKDLILQARRALGPEKEIANSIGMVFVLVPAGEFIMGSDDGGPDERPQHKVYLDAYYVGKYEVTNAQFEAFDPSHQRTEFSPADDMPVVAVSWRDALAFCRWLSAKEGVMYRLPTEAEWEKAARGTDGRTYPWGEEEPGAGGEWRCNIAVGENPEDWAADGYKYASAVDAYREGVSPFGTQGLAGNVWEWCADWYRADYYATGDARNPRGPVSGKQRVLRGGSFGNAARHARCANRSAHAPELVEATVGFRCVRALDPIFQEAP